MRRLDVDEVAARIRSCRAYAGLTRRELAEKMDTSPSTIERWEKAHPGSLGAGDQARLQMILWKGRQSLRPRPSMGRRRLGRAA